MSILNAASRESVARGYSYYKEGKVLSCKQIGDYLYEGEVSGSYNNSYHVIIDIEHPRKSICNCPHADGDRIVCKHKVALYFYLFPEEANDYQDWMNSRYFEMMDDVDDDYDYYDEEEYYHSYHYHNDVPDCYNQLLEEYINELSIEDLKDFVRETLNQNKFSTFRTKLSTKYEQYLKNGGSSLAYCYELEEKIKDQIYYIDYDHYDENERIFTDTEKRRIKEIIESNDKNREKLIDVLINIKLAIYSDYLWVVKLLKNQLALEQKEKLSDDLLDMFMALKHYSIRNLTPKSNILIALYELNDYSIDQIVESLIKNVKYDEYVKYLISHIRKPKEVYLSLKYAVDNEKYIFDKHSFPHSLWNFDARLPKDSKLIFNDYLYYNFIFNGSRQSLRYLIEDKEWDYVNKIKNYAKSVDLLLPLCAETNEISKLYKLIKDENLEYLYNNYFKDLSNNYEKELYQYYYNRVLEILSENKGNRELYKEAAKRLVYISKLNNGKELVTKAINDLKNSEHGKKNSLFDEIDKALKLK